MRREIKEISSRLQEVGVLVTPHSIIEYNSQGLMSKVYFAHSNQGPLIIHLGIPNSEQKEQLIWEKVFSLSTLLTPKKKVLNAPVLLSGMIRDKYFFVSKFINGEAAGGRRLKNFKIIDVWKRRTPLIEKQIEQQAAEIHRIQLPGAGWLFLHKGKLRGQYQSWDEFLDTEFKVWIKGIKQRERSTKLTDELSNFYKINRSKIIGDYHCLVHNDIINPGNLLTRNGNLVGVVDWEWSLAGDPAWEFSFNNIYSLKTYFQKCKLKYSKKEQEKFKERAQIYEVIYLTWGLYAHRKDKNSALYKHIRRYLIKTSSDKG